MGNQHTKPFSEKHGAGVKPDPAIKELLLKLAKGGELPCALAFQISKELNVLPNIVGKNLDLIGLRIVKCQLGLFGYSPKKKIVKIQDTVGGDLERAIQNGLVGGKLPCKNAWEIADRFNMTKMSVSAACETLGVKIKPCQLGAF